jgi:hypothetical protein
MFASSKVSGLGYIRFCNFELSSQAPEKITLILLSFGNTLKLISTL